MPESNIPSINTHSTKHLSQYGLTYITGLFLLLAVGMIFFPLGLSMTALLSHLTGAVDTSAVFNTYIVRVIGFTFWQSSLSTLISVGLAIPLARAFARRSFWGKRILLQIYSVAMVIPPIIAIYGLVVVHGRQGWVSQIWHYLNDDAGNYLYGLTGILLAHVFFNLPLVTRILLQRMDTIPSQYWRSAEQLGMTSWQHWRWIEWPHIRSTLLPLSALVFALCFTSFAIILSLGGGPKATTLEVAIYQAIRLDFDLPLASVLSLVQIILCGLIVALGVKFGRPIDIFYASSAYISRPDVRSIQGKLWDSFIFGVSFVLIILPLTGVVLRGINPQWLNVLGDTRLWQALFNSLWVAVTAAVLCAIMAWGLLLLRRYMQHLHLYKNWPAFNWLHESIGMFALVIPALVLGTGLFLALYQYVDILAINLYLVTWVNAVAGLPFMLRALTSAYMQIDQQQGRLCHSLGIQGWYRLRYIEWPIMRPALGLGLALVGAFALGDLGVIALFGTPDVQTLPLLLYQRLGSYQTDAAAVTACVLLFVCLGMFALVSYCFKPRSLR